MGLLVVEAWGLRLGHMGSTDRPGIVGSLYMHRRYVPSCCAGVVTLWPRVAAHALGSKPRPNHDGSIVRTQSESEGPTARV